MFDKKKIFLDLHFALIDKIWVPAKLERRNLFYFQFKRD